MDFRLWVQDHFVPLFAWFTMNIHRETVSTSPPQAIFSLKRSVVETLTYLGAISFPILSCGRLVRYSTRSRATKLFGFVFTSKPEFFPVWIGISSSARRS